MSPGEDEPNEAERLKEAQNTCAMLTTFNEIDMTWVKETAWDKSSFQPRYYRTWSAVTPTISSSNIKEMRELYKEAFLTKHNVKLGFVSAFAKAASHALMDQPAVNAGKLMQATGSEETQTLRYSFP